MGTYATAYLGMRVETSKLLENPGGQTCRHHVTSWDKFCSECGAKVLEKRYKDFVRDDADGESSVGGFKILEGGRDSLIYMAYEISERCVSEDHVPLTIGEDGSMSMRDSGMVRRFKGAMEGAGIWDPDAFGVFPGL